MRRVNDPLKSTTGARAGARPAGTASGHHHRRRRHYRAGRPRATRASGSPYCSVIATRPTLRRSFDREFASGRDDLPATRSRSACRSAAGFVHAAVELNSVALEFIRSGAAATNSSTVRRRCAIFSFVSRSSSCAPPAPSIASFPATWFHPTRQREFKKTHQPDETGQSGIIRTLSFRRRYRCSAEIFSTCQSEMKSRS